MASLSRDPDSGVYRIHFRYGSKQFHKSLKTADEGEAAGLKGRIELTLRDLERGRLALPAGADFWQFVLSDGKFPQKPEAPTVLTLAKFFERYEQGMPPGAMEENSLGTYRLHKGHLLRVLGGRTAAQSVNTTGMQDYVNARAKEKYRGKPIKSVTVKKEVATFRAVWNWGKTHGLLTGDAPTRGLRYEKERQKPPFQTWGQIERQVARGGIPPEEIKELWDALFLDGDQIAECLKHVKENAALPFVYPMFVFVAHTGARRSEMMRARVDDFDFVAKKVRIREKKKERKFKETYRHVDMTPLLERVMKEWLAKGHPGGPYAFCHGEVVARSRKRSRTTGHQNPKRRAKTLAGRLAGVRVREERPGPVALTEKEAHHHFKHALAGSKWEVVRGFHVFRHSFASNLAAAGARQQVIDGMLGHQTEKMRRRYRHLFPKETQNALHKVFGG